jgi:hypothetical protein
MSKLRLFVLVIISLVAVAVPFANAGEESLVIDLKTGETGENLDVAQLNLSKEQIELVNNGQCNLRIKIFNGVAEWLLAIQLAARDTSGQVNKHQLNMVFDAALNLAREQNVNRLLSEKGLINPDVQYVHDRAYSPSIEISLVRNHWVGPVQKNTKRITHLEHDYDVMSGELEALKDSLGNTSSPDTLGTTWDLRFGVEATAVKSGKPIVVPVISLEMFRGNFLFSTTGGYWPTGETDKKFAAASLAYFPGGHKLGLMARGVYASETIDLGYIQQGYGPTLGFIFRNSWLTTHLTGGIQGLDGQGEERHVKATIIWGAKFRALSF